MQLVPSSCNAGPSPQAARHAPQRTPMEGCRHAVTPHIADSSSSDLSDDDEHSEDMALAEGALAGHSPDPQLLGGSPHHVRMRKHSAAEQRAHTSAGAHAGSTAAAPTSSAHAEQHSQPSQAAAPAGWAAAAVAAGGVSTQLKRPPGGLLADASRSFQERAARQPAGSNKAAQRSGGKAARRSSGGEDGAQPEVVPDLPGSQGQASLEPASKRRRQATPSRGRQPTDGDLMPQQTPRTNPEPQQAPRTNPGPQQTPHTNPEPQQAPRTNPGPQQTPRTDPGPQQAPRTGHAGASVLQQDEEQGGVAAQPGLGLQGEGPVQAGDGSAGGSLRRAGQRRNGLGATGRARPANPDPEPVQAQVPGTSSSDGQPDRDDGGARKPRGSRHAHNRLCLPSQLQGLWMDLQSLGHLQSSYTRLKAERDGEGAWLQWHQCRHVARAALRAALGLPLQGCTSAWGTMRQTLDQALAAGVTRMPLTCVAAFVRGGKARRRAVAQADQWQHQHWWPPAGGVANPADIPNKAARSRAGRGAQRPPQRVMQAAEAFAYLQRNARPPAQGAPIGRGGQSPYEDSSGSDSSSSSSDSEGGDGGRGDRGSEAEGSSAADSDEDVRASRPARRGGSRGRAEGEDPERGDELTAPSRRTRRRGERAAAQQHDSQPVPSRMRFHAGGAVCPEAEHILRVFGSACPPGSQQDKPASSATPGSPPRQQAPTGVYLGLSPLGMPMLPKLGCGSCSACTNPALPCQPCLRASWLLAPVEAGEQPDGPQQPVGSAGDAAGVGRQASQTRSRAQGDEQAGSQQGGGSGSVADVPDPAEAAAVDGQDRVQRVRRQQQLRQQHRHQISAHMRLLSQAPVMDPGGCVLGPGSWRAAASGAAALLPVKVDTSRIVQPDSVVARGEAQLEFCGDSQQAALSVGYPRVALQEGQPLVCTWCQGVDHQQHQCPLRLLIDPAPGLAQGLQPQEGVLPLAGPSQRRLHFRSTPAAPGTADPVTVQVRTGGRGPWRGLGLQQGQHAAVLALEQQLTLQHQLNQAPAWLPYAGPQLSEGVDAMRRAMAWMGWGSSAHEAGGASPPPGPRTTHTRTGGAASGSGAAGMDVWQSPEVCLALVLLAQEQAQATAVQQHTDNRQ